jgi:sulfotransferase family protein
MPSDRPIFVVGRPRSGTTMLQLMLNAHPRIALPPANELVLPAFERRHEFGDLRDPRHRRALGQWIVAAGNFAGLGLEPAAVVDAIATAPPTLGSALGTVLQAYARRFGKPRWGDRRPAHLRHLPMILRLFPDAQIVDLIRDGRDCVASRRGEAGLDELIGAWARAADDSRRAARTYGPDVYHQVRYEDLVADPPARLREICGFLDEDYHPAMAPAGKAHTERVGGWRRRLSDDEIGRCEAEFGPRLTGSGYRPSMVLPATIRARHALRSARHAAGGVRARWRRARPDATVAARLTTSQRSGAYGFGAHGFGT